jgi:hypothetical protein
MGILDRIRPDDKTPAPGRYAGQSGEARPGDDAGTRWSWPAWTMGDLARCARGRHAGSLRPVVRGYIRLFTPVENSWCACGALRVIRIDDRDESRSTNEPGGHERWIQSHEELVRDMDKHRGRRTSGQSGADA